MPLVHAHDHGCASADQHFSFSDNQRQRSLLHVNDFDRCRQMRLGLVDVTGGEPPLPELDRLRRRGADEQNGGSAPRAAPERQRVRWCRELHGIGRRGEQFPHADAERVRDPDERADTRIRAGAFDLQQHAFGETAAVGQRRERPALPLARGANGGGQVDQRVSGDRVSLRAAAAGHWPHTLLRNAGMQKCKNAGMTERRSAAFAFLAFLLFCILALPVSAGAQPAALSPDQQLARDVFRELVAINTSYKGGATGPAAKAVADRFIAAGFPASDVRVLGPQGDKDSNVIVRMPGSTSAQPILLLAHLDVVEALRSDWSMEPFTLTERDGYFYGRGTSDIKDGAATLVTALLRMKRDRVTPARTLILALTAGEEGGGGYNGVQWLLANHRDLIDAELCLNVDGGDPLIKNGKRILRSVQSSEKLYLSFRLEVTNAGGHSSLRSEERRVGKECRCGWWRSQAK